MFVQIRLCQIHHHITPHRIRIKLELCTTNLQSSLTWTMWFLQHPSQDVSLSELLLDSIPKSGFQYCRWCQTLHAINYFATINLLHCSSAWSNVLPLTQTYDHQLNDICVSKNPALTEISPEVTSGTLRSVFLVTGGNPQRFPNEPGDDRFGMMTERKERVWTVN